VIRLESAGFGGEFGYLTDSMIEAAVLTTITAVHDPGSCCPVL
jgi:hypothetical protein